MFCETPFEAVPPLWLHMRRMQSPSVHIATQGAVVISNGATPIATSQPHCQASPVLISAKAKPPNNNRLRPSHLKIVRTLIEEREFGSVVSICIA